MIKVDLIEYLKIRKSELEAYIMALNLPKNECVRESRRLRHTGAIREIERLIKLIEKSSHD